MLEDTVASPAAPTALDKTLLVHRHGMID